LPSVFIIAEGIFFKKKTCKGALLEAENLKNDF
jgi:hypothetical protein